MFEQLNKNKKLFNVDVEKPTYRKLNDFAIGDVLRVLGVYTNKKSVYGEQAVFILQDYKYDIWFVNVPKRHIETIETITNNNDMVNEINRGKCHIKLYSYYSKKFNKECFDFNFTDDNIEDFQAVATEKQCIYEDTGVNVDTFTTQDIKKDCIF